MTNRYTNRFAFIPKGSYTIGQIIAVQGKAMRVESYSHTGKNVVAVSASGKFERVMCVCTDAKPIGAITA